jgi:hypothetical protein
MFIFFIHRHVKKEAIMSILNVPRSILKAINCYCLKYTDECGVQDVTSERLLYVMKTYKDEHGVLPTEWVSYMSTVIESVDRLNPGNLTKGDCMKNVFELEAKKLVFITEIIEAGADYTVEELHSMSLVEVRDIRDELLPLEIVEIRGTTTGTSIKRTTLKAA